MDISNLFQKARGTLTEKDFYEVTELKNGKRKKEIEKELDYTDELTSYDDIFKLSEYLETSIENIYISREGFVDQFSYFDKELGLLTSLYDGKIETAKAFNIKRIIEIQGQHLQEDLENKDYSAYFSMVESKIKFIMLNKRFKDIPSSQKYKVFKDVYSSSDYGFNLIEKEVICGAREGMSKADVLKLKNFADRRGYITIFRGMTEQSTNIKEAYSWTTDMKVAIFFSSRFSNEDHLVYKGKIHYKDVVAFIERRGEKEIVAFFDDISSVEQIDLLSLSELLYNYDFLEEYNEGKWDIKPKLFHNSDGIHGVTHAERVLFLVLAISHMEDVDEEDRELLITGAKYHDIGRNHDNKCLNHGAYSYKKMKELGFLIESSYENEELIKYIVENHCIDDKAAYKNIENYDIKDTKHAMYLLNILKDADNLDRVRISDLDPAYLRTESAKELVAIAYGLFNNKTLE